MPKQPTRKKHGQKKICSSSLLPQPKLSLLLDARGARAHIRMNHLRETKTQVRDKRTMVEQKWGMVVLVPSNGLMNTRTTVAGKFPHQRPSREMTAPVRPPSLSAAGTAARPDAARVLLRWLHVQGVKEGPGGR